MPSIDRRKAIFIDESKGQLLGVELAGTWPHSHGQKPRIEHQLHASPNSGIFLCEMYICICSRMCIYKHIRMYIYYHIYMYIIM